jgi:transcription termination factor Rho
MTKEIAAAGLAALNSMVESAEKLQLLLMLIERATSIAVVREFLKSRGIQHSAASWEELRTKRIFPAIDVDASSTRREELLMSEEELAIDHCQYRRQV